MKARTYHVTMTGETPLLMHNDNLHWSETMKVWGTDPANKKKSVAGDDRSPSWRWIGALYVDEGQICLPSDNIMTVLREGGAQCPVGTGKKTFKAQTQSGIVVDQVAWPILVNGKAVPYTPFQSLIEEPDFSKHEETAAAYGFMLWAKRAKIGKQKHVRVRPRFDSWSCSGTITVLDEMITGEILEQILRFAGNYSGVGDWRPSSPSAPGRFGKFTVEVKKK